MQVEIAEERILLLADSIGADQARTLAWAKRSEAFGAFARIGGLLSRPKDEDYEIVYSELRLQPLWRISASTTYVYERQRQHKLKLSGEVNAVTLGGESFSASKGAATITLIENCHEASQKDWLFDGLTKQGDPGLKAYLAIEPKPVTLDELNDMTRAGAVVLPPQAKPSMLTRDVISRSIRKIEADRILEETMRIDAIDLIYRPVYAHRLRWQGKEAVVEVDAVLGETKTQGTTFENNVGKLVDRDLLLDAGLEAANMILPGVTLARIIVTKAAKFSGKS
ncbi:MAG: hypothetical protein B7Z38_04540 [Rhodobacterales bacterium 12-64-8]|nr:MAG: hypothetical protein B7Z38_04540 [Rhodobacterales bacterium 12-64-8]